MGICMDNIVFDIEINNKKYCIDKTSYAFFFLDGREFGIAVDYVRETINRQSDLIRMPGASEIVEGLINLRGAVIPIINLRKRFRITEAYSDREFRIAITRFKGHLFGLIFDEISEVTRIRPHEFRKIETAESDVDLCGSSVVSLDDGKRIVQLLDLELLFKRYNLPCIDNANEESHQIFRPKKQNITFYLDGQEYALNVEDIREIINVPEIRRKVLVDPSIMGVISLRGELETIVDLRVCFGLPAAEVNEMSRIIILQSDLACGVLVDAIHEVVHFEETQLLPIPAFESDDCFSGIIAIEPRRNIIQINPALLFSEDLCTQIRGNLNLHEDDLEEELIEDYKERLSISDQVLISFELGEIYAFDILLFQEILEYSDEIIPLPGRKDHYEGVLNLRGTAIPIINMRRYYGMDKLEDQQFGKIIILNMQNRIVGIVVDSILEIIKPDKEDLIHIPLFADQQESGIHKSHVKDAFRHRLASGEERMLLIYDIERLVNEIDDQALDDPQEVNNRLG